MSVDSLKEKNPCYSHAHIHSNVHKSGHQLPSNEYVEEEDHCDICAIEQALWSWVSTNEHIIILYLYMSSGSWVIE